MVTLETRVCGVTASGFAVSGLAVLGEAGNRRNTATPASLGLQTLCLTHAIRLGSHGMEVGVSKTLWSISDIVKLADNPKFMRRDED